MVAFLLNVHSILSVAPGFDCFLTGYLGYFATMATFLWLSVTCFVYWRTFSRIMSSPGGMIGLNFLAFNLVAWTSAVTMAVVIFLVDFFQPFPEKNFCQGSFAKDQTRQGQPDLENNTVSGTHAFPLMTQAS
ncbi:probable G-protein coupled receptor Mth-like 11 [Drosophila ananassae]|uniref:probable G-protein coupled receptor Mth-like 11 n=1 Tax=Drosophila ananassae TaxID=7217 RepID=UPI0013A5DBA3|nr:probable G-protein coupled receptor Mth-like 11 [Drosophila ananassae]